MYVFTPLPFCRYSEHFFWHSHTIKGILTLFCRYSHQIYSVIHTNSAGILTKYIHTNSAGIHTNYIHTNSAGIHTKYIHTNSAGIHNKSYMHIIAQLQLYTQKCIHCKMFPFIIKLLFTCIFIRFFVRLFEGFFHCDLAQKCFMSSYTSPPLFLVYWVVEAICPVILFSSCMFLSFLSLAILIYSIYILLTIYLPCNSI